MVGAGGGGGWWESCDGSSRPNTNTGLGCVINKGVAGQGFETSLSNKKGK